MRLSFDSIAADATATSRYVEPRRLVALDARWYLVAYDPDRDDWRTFRVDRMSRPALARNTFEPRPPPARNLYDHVRFNMRERHVRQRIVLEVDAPGTLVRDRYGTWVEVDDLADDRCRVTIDADSFQWPTHIVANLDAPVTVISPPAFSQQVRSVARHLHAAARAGR